MKLLFAVTAYSQAMVSVEIKDDGTAVTTEFASPPKDSSMVTCTNAPRGDDFQTDVKKMITLMVERQLRGHMLERVEEEMAKLAKASDQAEFVDAQSGEKVSELTPVVSDKGKTHLN